MATEEHQSERRSAPRRILRQLLLLIGIVSLFSLGYGVRDIMADETDSNASLETIVSNANAIQLPALQVQTASRPIVQTAITMPTLQVQTASRPIVQTAITMPTLQVQTASRPIVQTAIAMPQLDATSLVITEPVVQVAITLPELNATSRPVLGSGNTIQLPQLAVSSVQSILGVGNDIVQPVLASELELPGSADTIVIETTGLPTTGSGASLNPGTTPTILILTLLALALSAAGLAIRVQRQIVTAPSLVQRQ